MTGAADRVRVDMWQARCRGGLSCFYLVAGILHLLYPAPFLSVTPAWVPGPRLVIAFTGLCELAGAIGLWVPSLRRYAGIGLALYALCVYPANVKHAIDGLSAAHPSAWSWIYHSIRLPLQPVIVWLALFAGRATTWPFVARAFR